MCIDTYTINLEHLLLLSHNTRRGTHFSEIFTKIFWSILKSVIGHSNVCIYNKMEMDSMFFPNNCFKLGLKMYFCFKSMWFEALNFNQSTWKWKVSLVLHFIFFFFPPPLQSSLKMSGSYCFKLSGHSLFNCWSFPTICFSPEALIYWGIRIGCYGKTSLKW